MRKWIDIVSENMSDTLFEGLEQVGSYQDTVGNELTMHRNVDNPTHFILIRDGQIVGNHLGDITTVHESLIESGLTGTLIESETTDEEAVDILGESDDLGA